MSVRTVMLVEDDRVLLDHLRRIVDTHTGLQVCAAFGVLSQARDWLRHSRPDVVLVDLDLPDGSGIELIREARRCGVECMVLTVFADEKHVVDAIRAGASGYLLKDEDDERVVDSILQLLAGQSPISAGIAGHILKHLRDEPPANDKADAEPAGDLTRREIEVLELMARGYSYQEVSDRISASINTVRTHVRHIYSKLEARSRGEAVYKAANVGLIKI